MIMCNKSYLQRLESSLSRKKKTILFQNSLNNLNLGIYLFTLAIVTLVKNKIKEIKEVSII